MTIPALDPKQKKFSSSTLRTFTGKIKKGSPKFWAFLTRHDNFLDEARVQTWKITLQSDHITKKQVRNAFKLTFCKHLDAVIRDKILTLLTKKTIFNVQIEKAYSGQNSDWYTDPHCNSCQTVRQKYQKPSSMPWLTVNLSRML